jgi:ABC-2 type transport system permease protein
MRIFELARKDLLQIARDRKAALFLIIMPILFTVMFGFAFGGFGGDEEAADPRLPVVVLDQDDGPLSYRLAVLIGDSTVLRLEPANFDPAVLEEQVADEELAAAVIVPTGYSAKMAAGQPAPVTVIARGDSNAGEIAESEIAALAQRLDSALRAARTSTDLRAARIGFASAADRQAHFDHTLDEAIAAWATPPVVVAVSEAGRAGGGAESEAANAFAQSSPGMIAQFAIAGLMGAATILVLERKNRSLQRLLTTDMSRLAILIGHFVAMLVMIFVQILILILFGQLLLKLNYLSQPLATMLLALATALFAASLGLLIGALAKTPDQVIIYSLIPMFVLAGMGGAWVPLEVMPDGFERVARLTPLAWTMQGFQDVLVRGLGLAAVSLPVAALLGYAAVLFVLAVWRFRFE